MKPTCQPLRQTIKKVRASQIDTQTENITMPPFAGGKTED